MSVQVNPDSLQEENIVTSTMNPVFARNSGATVSQILKNGTNALHGSGFEFYRDTFMNNGNYFSQVRPVFHQNLYGGTLGGSVFKNKLFFFMAYQGMRNRTSQTVLQPTLNADQFSGIFSSDPNYASGLSPDGSPSTHQLPNGSTVTFSDSLSLNPMPFAIGNCRPSTTWAACSDNEGAGNGTVDIFKSSWSALATKLIGAYVPKPNDGPSNYNFNAFSSAAPTGQTSGLTTRPVRRQHLGIYKSFNRIPASTNCRLEGQRSRLRAGGIVPFQNFQRLFCAYIQRQWAE